MASFRYLVNDVELSVNFYTKSLGFKLEEKFGPAMAIISKDDLILWLAGPFRQLLNRWQTEKLQSLEGGIVAC